MNNRVISITDKLEEREGNSIPGRFRFDLITTDFGYDTTLRDGYHANAGALHQTIDRIVDKYGKEARIVMGPDSIESIEYNVLVDVSSGKELEITRGREMRWYFGFKCGITGRAPINQINVEAINFGRFHYLNGYLEAALADYHRNDYLLGILLSLAEIKLDSLEIDSSRYNLNRIKKGRRDWQDALEQLLSGPEHQIKLKKSLIFLEERYQAVIEKMCRIFPKQT
jgi:hypothetical protein